MSVMQPPAKANFHTHTTRCMHAVGADEDYVKVAIESGYRVLGFSDHAPWPFGSGYVSPIRMPLGKLNGYIDSIKTLKEKYGGLISIHLGLESEYFPRYFDHLLKMRDMGIEYFILVQHYTDSEEYTPYVGNLVRTDKGVYAYAHSIALALETGLFSYVAHPDLYLRHHDSPELTPCQRDAADIICQAAKDAHVPLEYNLLGLESQLQGDDRGYPNRAFWTYVRKWGNDVIIGADAHDPEVLRNELLWQIATTTLQELDYNIVNTICFA